jgi:hypothetical protein
MSKRQFSLCLGANVTVAVCLWGLLSPSTAAAQSNQLSDPGCGDWVLTVCVMRLLSSIEDTTGPSAVETDSQTTVPYDVCLYTPPYVIGQLDDGGTPLYLESTPPGLCETDPVTADLPLTYPSSPPLPLPGEYIITSYHCLDDGCPYPDAPLGCDDIFFGGTIYGITQAWIYAGPPQATGITPAYIVLGSQGQITISGNYLFDPFTGQVSYQYSGRSWGSGGALSAPTYSGNAVSGTVTFNYSVVPGATRGSQTFTFSTRFGTSNAATTLVADHSPVITGVTSPWWAGGTATVTVNGSYFGVNPQVNITLANPNDTNCDGPCVGAPVITQHSNTQITFTVTIGANEPGNLAWVSVTSNGYDNNPPGFLGPQPPTAYWGTAPNIPINPLLATTPVISYFGNAVTQNQQVYAGREMALSAGGIVVPNGLSLVSTTWTIQGTAIASYTANTSSVQVTALPNLIPGTSVTFYWVDSSVSGGCPQSPSCSVTFKYELSNLQTGSAAVTFNVGAPTGASATTVATYWVSVFLDSNQTSPYLGENVLAFRPFPATLAGIVFSAQAALPPGNQGSYQWVQLINSDQSQYINSKGNQACTVFTGPAGTPELDGTYPYGNGTGAVYTMSAPNDTAIDGPGNALPSIYGEWQTSMNATMYLGWVPTVDAACTLSNACTIPVPLGSMTWWWEGDAINTLHPQTNLTNWMLNCGTNACGQNRQQPNIAFHTASPSSDPNYSYPTWVNAVPLLGSCH